MHNIEDNQFFIIKKCDVPIVRETMERANIDFNIIYETKIWDTEILGLEVINPDKIHSFKNKIIHIALFFWDNMTYYKRNGGIDAMNLCYENIKYDCKYPKSFIVTEPVAERIIDDCKKNNFPYQIKYIVKIDDVNMVCLKIERTNINGYLFMADITEPLMIEMKI